MRGMQKLAQPAEARVLGVRKQNKPKGAGMKDERTNTVYQNGRRLLGVVIVSMMTHLLLTTVPALAGGEPPAEQPAPVILTDEQGEYPLGLYLEILQDPGRELTIDDVASPEYDGQFAPSQEQVPNLGYTDSAIWVRFQARSEALRASEWRLELGFANIQHVHLFIPAANDQPSSQPGFQVKETGTLYPFAGRDFPYHLFVFRLPLTPGAEETFYLRFESEAAMTLPLTLWSVEEFAHHSHSEMLVAGLLYGTLLIMLGYNLFLWLTLRENGYLHYVLSVGAGTMFQLSFSGFAGQYLWPDLPWLNLYAVPFWCPGAVFFSLMFGATFLRTKARAPRQHKATLLLLALWGLMLVQVPFVPPRSVAQQEEILAVVSLVWLMVVGFTAWRRGYQAARYYLLAWIAVLSMLVVAILVRMSVLPSTPLTEHGYEAGMVLLVLFMSLALADQINTIKQERLEAQTHAMDSLREKEALIRGQNLMLEASVAERTAELRESENRYRAVSELTSDYAYAYRVEPDGELTNEWVTGASARTTGHSRQEPQSLGGWKDFLHPDDKATATDQLKALLSNQAKTVEYRIVTEDGRIRWMRDYARPTWSAEESRVTRIEGATQDITNRKQAEQQLAASEGRLSDLVSTMSDWTWEVDADAVYTHCSAKVESVLGYRIDEIIGKTPFDLMAPGEAERVGVVFGEIVRDKRPFRDLENVNLTKDGRRVCLLTSGIPMLADDGELLGYRGVDTDITDRKKAEEALAAEAIRRRILIEQSRDGIVVLHQDGSIYESNQRFAKMLGYSPEEISHLHVWDWEFQFTREQVQDMLGTGNEAGRNFETQHRRKDGTIYDAEISSNGAVFAGENLTFCVCRDITERKQAEEALRELNATLETKVAARTAEIRAEKEKNEAILSSVGDGIMMADREMRIQYVNPAFTTLTGYTAGEVLGRHTGSVGAAAESERGQQQSLESALAEGKQWQGEASSRRRDGRIYDAALVISPLRDAEGNLTGYVSSHRDISQRKNLERARNQFQANVSHQFRTPVTTLQLYVHLMQQAVLPEETRNHLRIMGEEIAWLIQLMQDILEMTALDSGKATTTWEPVSLSAMVAATITRYQSQAETSRLTLTAAPLPPDLPVVEGDQARLGQALGEVVENAIVFTPPSGQVTLSVETAEDEGLTWVVVAVQDTGPGIPPEEQEKVFDRFFRGTIAESGHTPGVGLGLSIAQEILRAHGGRVTVESGKAGSTFRLWLRAGCG